MGTAPGAQGCEQGTLFAAVCEAGEVSRVLAVQNGERVGTKKRDMRWRSSDGQVWASQFEYEVYETLKTRGHQVRRCTAGEPGNSDSLSYVQRIPNASCENCGSVKIGKQRVYTPDLYITETPGTDARQRDPFKRWYRDGGVYVECKGYVRAPQRTLLRSLFQARPGTTVVFILQRNYATSRVTLVADWIAKYLKQPVFLWSDLYGKKTKRRGRVLGRKRRRRSQSDFE